MFGGASSKCRLQIHADADAEAWVKMLEHASLRHGWYLEFDIRADSGILYLWIHGYVGRLEMSSSVYGSTSTRPLESEEGTRRVENEPVVPRPCMQVPMPHLQDTRPEVSKTSFQNLPSNVSVDLRVLRISLGCNAQLPSRSSTLAVNLSRV